MLRQNNRFLALCAAATAALALAGTAQAVDLRDWGRKFATAERFVVLSQFGSQAVLDKETQLVWERKPYAGLMASRYSAAIACVNLTIGDRRGWRLPFVHEIESLVNPAVPNFTLALPAGHPFQNVPADIFWTSTPSFQPTYGVVVNLAVAGQAYNRGIDQSGYRWCVRGAATDGML